MAVLDNPRWELYAQARAMGANQQDSYIKAKFEATGEAVHSCASRLERHEEVGNRIKELQLRLVKRGQITRLGIMDMLIESREGAQNDGQFSSAIRATELMGKEIGMFVDRHEIKANLFDEENYVDLERLRDQLINEAARRLAEGSGEIEALQEVRVLLPGNGSGAA